MLIRREDNFVPYSRLHLTLSWVVTTKIHILHLFLKSNANIYHIIHPVAHPYCKLHSSGRETLYALALACVEVDKGRGRALFQVTSFDSLSKGSGPLKSTMSWAFPEFDS